MDITREFEPSRVYLHIVEVGDRYADLQAAASLLAETKKTLLAELKTRSAERSDAAKEMEALASAAFKEHLVAMVEAQRQALRAKLEYDACIMLAELRRTEAVNRRNEMKFT